MRWLKIILVVALFGWLSAAGVNAQPNPEDATATVTSASEAAAKPEEGMPAQAQSLFGEHSLITNSMLVTWVVAIGIIIFARYATRKVEAVPGGAQNLVEWLVESLYDFIESIVGKDLVKKTFWFFATVFLFILFTNWFGLLPGVGTIGWGVPAEHGFEVTKPLLRGGNADLNMTFAMAAVFMVLWFIWSVSFNGVGGFLFHIFGPKGESTGFIKYMMIVIFFLVGFLEIISIGFRPVSLSFRLYGNVFAGENLLDAMSNVIQHPAWARNVSAALLPVPFYMLELLVGLVQAFVFMLLTTVFTALMCSHDDDHAKDEHH